MRKLIRLSGVAAPLIRNNIDTDAIIPSVEMKWVSKQGLAEGLFAAWRYSDRINRVPDPGFVLNRDEYRGATILISGANFGCGSSREHAVWALAEYGIRAIVAVSFGAIFHSNCIANGVLPICLPREIVQKLATHVAADPQLNRLHIDLQERVLTMAPGIQYRFEMAESDAVMLLEGLDPVSLTMRNDDLIRIFQEKDRATRPWVYL